MLNELNATLELIILQTQLNAHALTTMVLSLVGSLLLTSLFPFLLILGIYPRRWFGLPGILLSPLLHANFNHLFFNLIPLVVLSNFILITGLNYFIEVTLLITLISGVLTWCLAKPGIHIGASGVITGYWALLVSNIYAQGTFMAVILGLVSVYYFFGIFFGIFPTKKGVSWEGHLFGLVAGIVTSELMKSHIF